MKDIKRVRGGDKKGDLLLHSHSTQPFISYKRQRFLIDFFCIPLALLFLRKIKNEKFESSFPKVALLATACL